MTSDDDVTTMTCVFKSIVLHFFISVSHFITTSLTHSICSTHTLSHTHSLSLTHPPPPISLSHLHTHSFFLTCIHLPTYTHSFSQSPTLSGSHSSSSCLLTFFNQLYYNHPTTYGFILVHLGLQVTYASVFFDYMSNTA